MSTPIVVSILGDNRDLVGKVGQSRQSIGTLGKATRAAAAITATAAGTAGAAVVALGVSSVDSASKAQQSLGATQTVFGKYAAAVRRDSRRAAREIGVSANEYRELSNVTGALLQGAGMPLRKTADLTGDLNKRAADLAATFGGTTREAVEAISSLMKGEADPIERYGISIKQSDVNARLAAQGLAGLTGEAKKQAEMQARVQHLMDQSAKSSGAFARETNTLAHQQQVAGAQFENIKATLGTALLPVLTKAGAVINSEVLPPVSQFAATYAPRLAGALDGISLDSLKPSGDVGANLSSIAASVKELGPALVDGAQHLPSFTDLLSVSSTVLAVAADHTDLLVKALPLLAAGYVAVKVGQTAANAAQVLAVPTKIAEVVVNRQLVASNRALIASRAGLTTATTGQTAAENVGTASRARSVIAMVAQKTTTIAVSAATKAAAAGQWLLNAALTANPIGLVVIAVAALVGGLVLAYKKSDTFRRIVNAAFGTLKTGVLAAGRVVVQLTGRVTRFATTIGAKVLPPITKVVGWLAGAWMNSFRLASRGITAIVAAVGRFAGRLTAAHQAAVSFVAKVVGAIKGLPAKVLGVLTGLGGDMRESGKELMQMLADGIRAGIDKAVGALKSGADKLKGLLPGSPVKWGPLTSWNNGGAGRRLMDLLAVGIADSRTPVAALRDVAADLDREGRRLTGPTLGSSTYTPRPAFTHGSGLAAARGGEVVVVLEAEQMHQLEAGRRLAIRLNPYLAAGGRLG